MILQQRQTCSHTYIMTTPTLFPVQGLSDTLGTYADLRLLYVSVGVMHWAWPNQPTLGSFREQLIYF